MVRRVSRRGVLASAGGAFGAFVTTGAAVETELLPGRSWVYRQLGMDGPDGIVPRVTPGPSTSGSFVSEARQGRTCGWTVAYPPGEARALPVVVVLHGKGADHADAFGRDGLALDVFLAEAVGRGTPPFALASVDGGDSYWHARESGEDAATMVTEELLPLLERAGLDTTRIGLLGWSMGGFGALHIASGLGPDRVAAVTCMSPALFRDYGDTTPGAFDDEADFAEVTPFGRQDRLTGIPIRIDCGEGDPFYRATRDYRDSFDEAPAGGFARGDHDRGYWRRIAPAQLAFIGKALRGG
ncbi:esterase [Nocardioides sp.]|nr:esterase [Nocardioides sp.]